MWWLAGWLAGWLARPAMPCAVLCCAAVVVVVFTCVLHTHIAASRRRVRLLGEGFC